MGAVVHFEAHRINRHPAVHDSLSRDRASRIQVASLSRIEVLRRVANRSFCNWSRDVTSLATSTLSTRLNAPSITLRTGNLH